MMRGSRRETSPMTGDQDAGFADYMSARRSSLLRLAIVLCQDPHRADDLLQAAMTRTYVYWHRAARANDTDAYVRAILVREFIRERQSGWARRVRLTDQPVELPAAAADTEGALDLRRAVAALPPRQRAVLVLRYYCDLNIEQSAEALGCSPGTIKSQTARALGSLRRSIGPEYDVTPPRPRPAPDQREPRRAADNA
jgi:RNA polymerase sigma-70 factor (sigma-E family)